MGYVLLGIEIKINSDTVCIRVIIYFKTKKVKVESFFLRL